MNEPNYIPNKTLDVLEKQIECGEKQIKYLKAIRRWIIFFVLVFLIKFIILPEVYDIMMDMKGRL